MTKIKICGIRRKEDIEYVNEYKPDFIGFIFVKDRFRYVEPSLAKELKSMLNKDIKAVGVFLDEDINTVIDIAKSGIIDIIQLHGHEDENYIKEVKEKTQLPIINVYNDSKYCDYVLTDNINPGSGESWDYGIIGKKPCFIAGGVSINNIKDVLKLKPYAVDVSSSVETNKFKDKKKIEEIIREVRSYEG